MILKLLLELIFKGDTDFLADLLFPILLYLCIESLFVYAKLFCPNLLSYSISGSLSGLSLHLHGVLALQGALEIRHDPLL